MRSTEFSATAPMRLKTYQEHALDDLSAFLGILREAEKRIAAARAALQAAGVKQDLPDAFEDAWDAARQKGIHKSLRLWVTMKSSAGIGIPHVCIKLPTGGGKTFAAAHAVDRLLNEHFSRQTGFVLWVTPSDAIYQQTLRQLRDRDAPFRQVLERASGGRVKLLEKLDPFTAEDVRTRLCVMLLMLQSANRSTLTKGDLKIRSDSGSYPSFFPEEDDRLAHNALLKQVPNLERNDLAEGDKAGTVKASLENVLRIVRPVVVLDEGHKAYSDQARATIANLNPAFVIELSATPKPKHSNILVNVPGKALKDEEMIKLPIVLDTVEREDWQVALERALERLDALAADARALRGNTSRYIRPILLVRVDRTGKDQRGGGFIHADDVIEYLTAKRGMLREEIKLQTADVKELRGEDLLLDTNLTRVIVTKDALREGWDCPFAYVLCLLSTTQANTALTQMVGRVLRQPQAQRTGVDSLDRCYVFAKDVSVAKAVEDIKGGLEAEGMSDLVAEIDTGGTGPGQQVKAVTIQRRGEFKGMAIMVPTVLHRRADGGYEELDYEAHVLRHVDWDALTYDQAGQVDLGAFDPAKRATAIVDLDARVEEKHEYLLAGGRIDRPGMARLMLTVVPNPWQGVRIVDEALAELRKRYPDEEIARCRFGLVEDIKSVVGKQVDANAEAVFRRRVDAGEIAFKLAGPPSESLNWTVQQELVERVTDTDPYEDDFQRFLFERLYKRNLNGFEEDVALKLDGSDAIRWWHRIAARGEWGLQGWRKHKVYPDFLVCLKSDDTGRRLLVLETKGDYLSGHHDTEFKRRLFEILEAAFDKAHDVGAVELVGQGIETMRFKMLMEDRWQPELQAALA
jgi:type III restriction enzyme